MAPDVWSLILSPHDRLNNMALDEALLESAEARFLTLRLYAWDPPCLSIGYAQPFSQVDRSALRRRNWDLVRRPTGGRAILHTDELTYAVVAADQGPVFAGGVMASYRRLSAGLALGVSSLGLAVQVQPGTRSGAPTSADPVCFQTPAAHEITVDGRKLLGSAQLRRRGGLQHGSFRCADLGRICLALHYPSGGNRSAARRALRRSAATAEELLGAPLSWELAAQALVAGFQQALGAIFEQQEPSASELQRAAELNDERYRHPAWTERI
jgi:lipoate-protein ligase A